MDHRALGFPDLPAERPRRLPEALREPLRLTVLGGSGATAGAGIARSIRR